MNGYHHAQHRSEAEAGSLNSFQPLIGLRVCAIIVLMRHHIKSSNSISQIAFFQSLHGYLTEFFFWIVLMGVSHSFTVAAITTA